MDGIHAIQASRRGLLAEKSDFLKFIGTPFERFILPIIPAGAKLAEESSLTQDHLGKIPGKWAHGPKVWYGFLKWQSYWATRFDLQKWQAWQEPDKADTPIAVALRLGEFVAIDIDINHPELADYAEVIVVMTIGAPLCVRRRGGNARRVLIYVHQPRTMPITKGRIAFKTPLTGDEVNAIEVLGEGQQVVIEGPHAKGAMHYWLNGKGLTDLSREDWRATKPLTRDDSTKLTMTLAGWINGQEGWSMHLASGGRLRERGTEHKIDSPVSPLIAKNLGLLKRAIEAIDINHDRFASYDAWFPLFLAICAACGANMEFFHDTVLPWLLGFAGNTEEAMEAKWLQQTTSELGADYVYKVAASAPFNFLEGVREENDGLAATLYGEPSGGAHPDSDQGGDGRGDEGGAAVGNRGSGGGPLPPGNTDVGLRDAFVGADPPYRYIIEFRYPNGWQRQLNGIWVPAYPEFARSVADHCSAIGDAYRLSGGKEGAKADRELKNANTHARLERMLAKEPALVKRLAEFDAVPYLFNTSRWVVDLREMTGHEHEPSDLFRLCAAVSPDFGALGPPVRWLRLLERMSGGRPWLPEALQLWFGYSLTGYVDWELILFIWGLSGSGKTLISQVINELVGSYSKIKKEEFFILQHGRGGDGRFDMDDLAGLRIIIGDETQPGSTWNETRMSRLSSGVQEDVEHKNVGGKLKVRPQAKITINGNHKPGFPTGDRAGGLARRLMLLEMGPEYVVPKPERQPELLHVLVQEEGQQIMTWLLEGAYKALKHGKHYFEGVAQPMFDAAAKYVGESDQRRQWMKDRRIVEGDKNKDYITLQTAYLNYLDYRQTENRGYRETRRTFKTAMEGMGWAWEEVNRGEPDQDKRGYIAAYGWKFSNMSMGDAADVYVGRG